MSANQERASEVAVSRSESLNFQLDPSATPMSADERRVRLQNPGFGRVFTEHMITLRYVAGRGWHDGRLEALAPLELWPSASSLHYGQAIFEGFKAYRQDGGSIATFRPHANAARFNRSANRLAMPELPVELFVEASDLLIAQDREWVPTATDESLYLRPLMIATESALGVRPSSEYLFLVFASPAGSYFPQGVKPVSVWISTDFVRASPGGTGAAKCAGNYAASLLAQQQAQSHGCDQVVWLDAVERRRVEELGGMNIFFVYRTGNDVTLVTPELSGTLLAGVTRDSLLKLARDSGYQVEERTITVDDWERDLRAGRMTEVFACGTAAVITPVGTVKSERGTWALPQGQTGSIAASLRKALLDIQYGRAKDRYGWMHRVCDAERASLAQAPARPHASSA
jgi:branched-chain amino acid aminotransferase